MCGIAGFLGTFDASLLEAMNRLIAHRGPDDSGRWHDPAAGVGLAQRRLAIIDLSPAGHQPMWDASGTVVIVFNGEIYNYRELREELLRDGFGFAGHSDTEVILNLYRRDGAAFLPRLNGIFAFALWDPRRHELLVARDGMGVKPLYWTRTPRGFVFASELKALLALPDLDRTIDPDAVFDHLSLLYATGDRTMLRSVRRLLPGHALALGATGAAREWEFYRLPDGVPDDSLDDRSAAEGLRDCLATAVRRQMVADVPVGAFLSGGLDSSSVVHFARAARAAAGGDGRVPCFTIGFEDTKSGAEGFAEDLPYARLVAQHLGVDLHTVWVKSSQLLDLDRMVWHLDEPLPDPAALNVLHICRLAREHGIKVLLSGAGGDDLLTGYRRHRALGLERFWSGLPDGLRRGLRRAASWLPVDTAFGRRAAKLLRYAHLDGDERLASYFVWLDDPWVRRMLSDSMRERLPARRGIDPLVAVLRTLPAAVPPVNRMLALDSRFFLTDHNLNYTDKLAMAVGVEVRVPFLDPDLVAFCARLPVRCKQRGAEGKWLLKQAMAPHLPREAIHRPKSGFGAPLRRWLHQELRAVFEQKVRDGAFARHGLFSPDGLLEVAAADRAGRVDAAYPLFGALCLESWCRQFLDAAPAAPARPAVDLSSSNPSVRP